MEIIHVEDLACLENEGSMIDGKYQGNITVVDGCEAYYTLGVEHYFIPQQLLEEIINLKALEVTEAVEEEQAESEFDSVLDIMDLMELAIVFSADDLCNLRANGLI